MNVKGLDKLDLDKTYKYPELCILFEEKKKIGKSKILQIKDWKRYCNIEKGEKATFIITEIYGTPKPKIDKRKGNSGKSKGSRNNNGTYAQYADVLLLHHLKESQDKDDKLYTTNNKLAETCGLINSNYRYAFDDKNALYTHLHKEHEDITKTAIFDVFSRVKGTVKGVIKSALDRLQEQEIIFYDEAYFIKYPNYNIQWANNEKEGILIQIEQEVLETMNINDKNVLQYNDKLRNEYYKKCEHLAIERIEGLEGYFKGYRIFLYEDIPVPNNIDFDEYKQQLNETMVERTYDKLVKQKEKVEHEHEGLMGAINPLWDSYTKDRLKKNYLDNVKIVIDTILNLDAAVIKEDLIRIKNYNNKISQYSNEFDDLFGM